MAEEETFKVTDRRGHSKSTEPGMGSSGGSATPVADPPLVEPADRPAPPPRAESRPPDLQGLFVMFASAALISLGEAPDPSGERRVDLEQAREAVDMLLLLRDKTNGNRTVEESRFLEEVLYDLQMRYVRAAREGPPR